MDFRTSVIVAVITQADIDRATQMIKGSLLPHSGLLNCVVSRVVDEDLRCNSYGVLVKTGLTFGFLGSSGSLCNHRLYNKHFSGGCVSEAFNEELGVVLSIYMLRTPFEGLARAESKRFFSFIEKVRERENRCGLPQKEAVRGGVCPA